jgi:prephenate dehydratase
MQSYSPIAQAKVTEFETRAAANPAAALSFQGAPGANSHLAASEFDAAALPLPCFSFEDAIEAVQSGRAGRAIIPIENSLHGRVADIHFLLPESGLSIVDEHFLRVRHSLMAKDPAVPVTRAYSHVQALGQCRHYLKERGIAPVAYADTAAAAAYVADHGEVGEAAIAPALAAEIYGLSLIAEGIEDADHNMTRFVVLSRSANDAAALDALKASGERLMTTLVFEVKNIPAALYKAMGGFATNGVNMTKLESYQKDGSFSATEFYADIDGHPGDPAVDRALEELDFHCKELRLLGTYRQARARG